MQTLHETNKTLDYEEIEPNQPAKASVIWLHGLGADGHDFVELVPILGLPEKLAVRFIFPHAPLQAVTINNGYVMRAWYDIALADLQKQVDEAGIHRSVALIEKLIENELQRGIPAERIILAGFSQGAVLALVTGLCYGKTLGGILALSGYLPNAEQILTKAAPANKQIPIFLAHGANDGIVPHLAGLATCSVLQKNHYQVDWHSYMMEHSVCAEEIQDISKWLINRFNQ